MQERPKKDIVKGTVISAVVIGLLFLALSLLTIGTATYGNQESKLSPIGVIMGDTVGLGAKVITAILALIISTGTSNTFVASLTQLGYSLSRDGAFPKFFQDAMEPLKFKTDDIIYYLFIADGCFSDKGFITDV